MRRNRIAFALLLLLALLLLCGCGNKGQTALPSPTPVPTPEPDYSGQLRISEFMTKNKAALADESGAFPDWVELECIAASPVDLSGWALSDRPGTAKLPLDSRAAQPGELTLFFCGEDSFSLPGRQGPGSGALPRECIRLFSAAAGGRELCRDALDQPRLSQRFGGA